MDINLSFSDIYTDATLKYTIKQKKKLNKNKEIKNEEDEKLTSLMKNIKQDRKALYKEIKEMDKKIDDDDITAHTEEGDEFLKNYLKSIGVEAKRFKDKKDD